MTNNTKSLVLKTRVNDSNQKSSEKMETKMMQPLLEIVLGWRLTGDLVKAAQEFKMSSVDDLKPDPFSTFHHLRDGFGGHYYGEMDSRKRRHGFGRCRWSNGDLYFGFWSKDQMHGEGNYLWIQTGSIYVGTWKRGECHGPGTYVCGPGKETATLIDPSGLILKGTWKRGHPKNVQVLSARLSNKSKAKLVDEEICCTGVVPK